MATDHPNRIIYIVIFSLLAIISVQAFLVVDYYKTTRKALIRESEAIMHDGFKMDLDKRLTLARKKRREVNLKGDNDSVIYDSSKLKEIPSNTIEALDLIMNIDVSKDIPLNIQKFDRITGSVLESRGIHSTYYIELSEKVGSKTKTKISKPDKSILLFLEIRSKPLIIDIKPKRTLTLVLVNPLDVILKRMGLMLISSVLFSLICFIAFGQLMRILSRQKQLVRFKNDFLSTIAHELRRPVASLSFNLDCLLMPAFKTNESKHDATVCRSLEATTELNSTINMIVALAKVEEGLLKLNKKETDLKQVIEQLVAKFRTNAAKKVEITTTYETHITCIYADEQLLSQCFANLIDNAVKYSGKEVVIVISIAQSDKWLVVSISDNGIGIPAEKLPVIFEKYVRIESKQVNVNGFGIGLNYVKTIVQEHKGDVTVESDPGKGTRFSVLLPTK
jgi:two-component system, OmpR family, phosphate regulon sensor histidine kinase PhoR